ncbi:MAG TPA: DMT family transporter [Rectinemataceae bacterium]|nr:DMT family transporter [Rectinemataceae bacterium]
MGKKIYPELAVAVASAAWGLFWIPLRAFNRNGLPSSWAVCAQFLAPLVVLLPWALVRALRKKPTGIGQYRTGLLVGCAVTLYLESLLLTTVARSLILFYLMPTWATVLEVAVMHRPLTRIRILSLGLGIAGLLVLIVNNGLLSVSLNLGDALALLSGILFSFGALGIRRTAEASLFEQLFSFFLFGSLAACCIVLLPLLPECGPPAWSQAARLAPWLLLMAVGFLIPVMSGIYWGSRRVNPGRLGILLQIEAVVGILSAAVLAGEAFGFRQTLGAVLVIGAGLIEVLANQGMASEGERSPAR